MTQGFINNVNITFPLGVTLGGTGLTGTIANQILYSTGTNVIAGLATANNSVLVTSAGGVPSLSTTLPNFTTGSITFSPSTAGIIGTTTNNNASAGYVGEYVSSSFASGLAITSTSVIQVATIALPAGDWDVWGMIYAVAGVTTVIRQLIALISTSAASLITPTSDNTSARTDMASVTDAGSNVALQTGVLRVSIAGSTNYYVNAYAGYSVSTLTMGGIIKARRVR